MTWEIFLGISALVGFLISIGKIISNNTKAMTEIKMSLDELNSAFGEQKNNIEHLESNISNHEHRLTVLETKENQK